MLGERRRVERVSQRAPRGHRRERRARRRESLAHRGLPLRVRGGAAMRAAFLGLTAFVLSACASDSDRTLPPPGQLLLYVDTDAPLPPPAGETLRGDEPSALFEHVRIDVFRPG